MMPFDPMPAAGLGLLWLDEPDCPACAGGWHGRCRRAEPVDDPSAVASWWSAAATGC
jgi:hypothetical protein